MKGSVPTRVTRVITRYSADGQNIARKCLTTKIVGLLLEVVEVLRLDRARSGAVGERPQDGGAGAV
ncbi:MAG: hypothetical protein ABI920_19465, partial [Casimicrobiaceae bacterium]